jgi:hypothetical protein
VKYATPCLVPVQCTQDEGYKMTSLEGGELSG